MLTAMRSCLTGRERRRRGGRGFTAVETLVVLAILGLFFLMSIPALMDFFRAMKVRTASQRMTSHFRLSRQVAVTRRARVAMEIEGKDAEFHTYRAWEDQDADFIRDPDERWVVREVQQLRQDSVWVSDTYDDTTPASGHDESPTSLMPGDILRLWFYPNGQILRVTGTPPSDDGDVQQGDTLLRTRLRGRVSAERCDQWELSYNRPGKVSTDLKRLESPIPEDCVL